MKVKEKPAWVILIYKLYPGMVWCSYFLAFLPGLERSSKFRLDRVGEQVGRQAPRCLWNAIYGWSGTQTPAHGSLADTTTQLCLSYPPDTDRLAYLNHFTPSPLVIECTISQELKPLRIRTKPPSLLHYPKKPCRSWSMGYKQKYPMEFPGNFVWRKGLIPFHYFFLPAGWNVDEMGGA